MISEEKLKIMTKMAIYDKNEGKDDFEIGKYYKKDYLTFNYIKTWICATIAYLGLWCLILVANMDTAVLTLGSFKFVLSVIAFILFYVLFVLVYEVLTYKIYSIKYDRAKKRLNEYMEQVEELNKMYEKE